MPTRGWLHATPTPQPARAGGCGSGRRRQ
jgi:hypothetical protein